MYVKLQEMEVSRLQEQRAETWRHEVLPSWSGMADTPRIRELLELGVPEVVRPAVWSAAAASARLELSRTLYARPSP